MRIQCVSAHAKRASSMARIEQLGIKDVGARYANVRYGFWLIMHRSSCIAILLVLARQRGVVEATGSSADGENGRYIVLNVYKMLDTWWYALVAHLVLSACVSQPRRQRI